MMSSNTLKDRDRLYRHIISQFLYDGHSSLAFNLTNAVKCTAACPPSDRLSHLVNLGLKAEGEQSDESIFVKPVAGIDLDFETEATGNGPEPSTYETVYVTSHKGACRAGAFNGDGSLVATGSADASIKILDVEKMIAKSISTAVGDDSVQGQSADAQHPVIRTLYDHIEEVTTLTFHPNEQLLISGSADMTIKIYDFAKPAVKRALKTFQESDTVRCIAIHPDGGHIFVGTNHQTLRIYDIRTGSCYVGPVAKDQHTWSITSIAFGDAPRLYASCSKDGDIKIWDGVSSRCIATYPKAHEGAEVCSVEFSRNGKYILSSGKDSLVKLWEVSMSRCLIAYTGAGTAGKQMHRAQAVFNHTEDYVLFPDEKTTSLCVWDARNAERQKLLALGHNNAVRHLCHSPSSPAFLTCSDDFRARFWYRRPDTSDI